MQMTIVLDEAEIRRLLAIAISAEHRVPVRPDDVTLPRDPHGDPATARIEIERGT